jgi:hypothetical protein
MPSITYDVHSCHNDSPLRLLQALDLVDFEIEYLSSQVESSIESFDHYLVLLEMAYRRRKKLRCAAHAELAAAPASLGEVAP